MREAKLICIRELKWGRGKTKAVGFFFLEGVLRLSKFQGMFSLCVENIKMKSDKERTFRGYILKIKNSSFLCHFVKIEKELEN